MPRTDVRLIHPHGLHARPAAMFSMTASGFSCDVKVSKNGRIVNGKSVISLIGLDCRTGDQVCIITSGVDEDDALEQLAELLEKGLDGG
ncbi:MAG: phosphocarrier protein HPr [Frankiaceae bacterium]|nr:phosphocarrier protein HPr [Frankiaceae bacterium]